MRTRKNITIGITSVAAVCIIIFLVQKIKKEIIFERLDRIAEEGYETAGDILFPNKKKPDAGRKPSEQNDYSSNNVIFV